MLADMCTRASTDLEDLSLGSRSCLPNETIPRRYEEQA